MTPANDPFMAWLVAWEETMKAIESVQALRRRSQ
jgi:hypothetical protein